MPSMIRRLTSAPKPCGAGLLVHLDQVVGVDAQPVADAVVAGQVRGGLGRGDHVVGGDPVRRVRQLGLGDLAAELLDQRQRPLEDLAHAGLDPLRLAASSFGHAEAQALEVLAARAARCRPRSRPRSSRRGRGPRSAASSSAASVTSRVSGPHWSSEEAKAIIP